MNVHYSMFIQWSEEDQCFVVSLPEWGEFCHTHGATYEEAVQNAREVLDMLITSAIAEGELLPEPLREPYRVQRTSSSKHRATRKRTVLNTNKPVRSSVESEHHAHA